MTEPLWDTDLAEPDESYDRSAPHNLEAEKAALGSMLFDLKNIDLVDGILASPDDFYEQRHQIIYRAITDLYCRDRKPKIDPITVSAGLLASGDINKVGGAAYLHHLMQFVPVMGNADGYAEIVREHAQLRAVLTATRTASQRVLAAANTAAEILDAAMADLQAAAKGVQPADEKLSVADRWMGFVEELEAGHDPRALDTPWPDLNDIVELKPGQLITVGSRHRAGQVAARHEPRRPRCPHPRQAGPRRLAGDGRLRTDGPPHCGRGRSRRRPAHPPQARRLRLAEGRPRRPQAGQRGELRPR